MFSSRLSIPWRALAIYGGSTLLVVVAVAFTILRLTLAHVEGYRAEVERQIGAYLGRPVRMARLEALLPRFSPSLVMSGVQLLDARGQRPIVEFREIRIGIDVFESLLRRTPVLDRLTVVGASLAVERRRDGSFRVQGLSLPQSDKSDPEAVGRWLLARDRIALVDSKLVWRDAVTGKNFSFQGASLELSNSGERHRLNARVQLPPDLGGKLRLAVDMDGDPLSAGGLRGGFYVGAEEMRPAGLLRLFPLEGISPGSGELSFEVWGDWKQATLVSAQGRLEGDELTFATKGGVAEQMDGVAARFSWEPQEKGWRLDVADLTLTRAGRTWQPSRVRVDLAKDDSGAERAYRLQASFLRLEDMAAIAALVPLPGEWQRKLAAQEVRGDLSDVHVEYQTGGKLRAGAAFTDLSMPASQNYPGASGLDGYAYFADGAGGVWFATRDAHLDLAGFFRAPLVATQLDGEVRVERDGPAWRVSSEGLVFANEDIRLRAALALQLPDGGKPFLDLRGDFHDGDATSVARYLPTRIMPASAVAWLDRAFLAGRVTSGNLLVHGRLDQFPFDHGEGRFEVRFGAEAVDLDYVPGWPRLTEVNGEVEFSGRRMQVEATHGNLVGDQVSRATVAIPDLLNPRLGVKGHVEGDLRHLFDYLGASRLAGHLTPALARFQAGGRYLLDLDFEHPLKEGMERGRAGGELSFEGSRLALAQGVEFTDVRGQLSFRDQNYTSEGIDARLFGAPTHIRVWTLQDGAAPVTRVSLEGAAISQAMRRSLDIPLLARLRGRAPWEAQLTLAHQEGGESVLHLYSPLTGLAIDLPEPLGKAETEKRDLAVRTWFSGPRAGELEATFGDRATASFGYSESKLKAAVNFGTAIPPVPTAPGYVISGRLPTFKPAEWAGISTGQGGAFTPELPPIRIDMDELGIVSEPDVDNNPATKPLDIPDSLPPLDVRVAHLRYNQLSLGDVSFRTTNEVNRVLLNDLKIRAPKFTVAGKGEWQRGRKPQTTVHLKTSGEDLGAAAKALGFASIISDGTFDVNSDLTWNGGPQDVNVANVEGILKLRIKDGTVNEVKPGAGKLLGLLSVQALPHRLMLDFSDLFDEGMRFRTIEGTIKLRDGDAFSDNLHMNALPAAVFVSGRTGLVNRDFDQKVRVVPDVSGTLPVAGGLWLGPQVGAALLLVQQLFRKQIDKASEFKYTVKGSWDDPVITEIGKKH